MVNKTQLYRTWVAIRQRCHNPHVAEYPRYGGRGITVCPEWEEFELFQEWALDNGFHPGLTIDRINNNGNYEPNNCRWTTVDVQNRNKRSNIWITAFGETRILADWVSDTRCTVTDRTLRNRLAAHWDTERAITTPARRSSQYRGVSYHKTNCRWQAFGRRNRVQVFLGYFDTEVQAKQAIDKWNQPTEPK